MSVSTNSANAASKSSCSALKYSAQRAPLNFFVSKLARAVSRPSSKNPRKVCNTPPRISLSRTASVLACRNAVKSARLRCVVRSVGWDFVLAIKSPRLSIAHIVAKKRLVDGFNPAYQIAPAGDRANLAPRVGLADQGQAMPEHLLTHRFFSVPRPARQIVASHPEPRRCRPL